MEIYTDGSCTPNPGKGGWAFVAVDEHGLHTEGFGNHPDTTNNRMEFQAVIKALDWLETDKLATVYCDSQLVVNVLNETWRGKKNLDLVKIAREKLTDRPMVDLKWIRGHNGNRWNEHADQLAAQVAGQTTARPQFPPIPPPDESKPS